MASLRQIIAAMDIKASAQAGPRTARLSWPWPVVPCLASVGTAKLFGCDREEVRRAVWAR